MRSLTEKINSKIISLKDAIRISFLRRKTGKRVVMTNGCFDLLHAGHIYNLTACKEQGDVLIVLVNSDKAVRELKGLGRPLQTEEFRAFSIAALAAVDYVVILDSETVIEPLKSISPTIWAKGADRNLKTLNQTERQIAESMNIDIRFIPFVKGHSTTYIISQIANIIKVEGKF